jgi:hypothetical protein
VEDDKMEWVEEEFGELGLFIEFVPSKVDVAIAEIAHELIASPGNVIHHTSLQETTEEKDLELGPLIAAQPLLKELNSCPV